MNLFQDRIAAIKSQLLEMQNNLLLTRNPVQNPNAPRPQLLQRIDYMLKKIELVLNREKKEAEEHKTPKLNPGMQSDAEAISKAQQKEDEKRRREEARRQREEEEEAQELERVIVELKKQEQLVKEIEFEQGKLKEIDEAIATLQRPLDETRETIIVTEKALQKTELLLAQEKAAQGVQQATVVASVAPAPTPDLVQTSTPLLAPVPTPISPTPQKSVLDELKEQADMQVALLQTLKESERTIELQQGDLKIQAVSSKQRLGELTAEYVKSVKALEGTSSKVVERAAMQAGMTLTPTPKPHGNSKAEEELNAAENKKSSTPTLTPPGAR